MLASLFIAVAVPARAQSTPAPAFSDVPRGHWAFEAVQKLADDGIVVGLPETSSNRAQAVAAKVQRALDANATLKKAGIWVAPLSTTDKLAVRGVVPGWAQVRWALHLAKQAAPDFEIVNQLGIKTSLARKPAVVDWATLVPIVKSALSDSKALEGTQIDVDADVTNRVVYLKGTVRDAAQKALAGAIARQELSKRTSASKFTLRNELTTSR